MKLQKVVPAVLAMFILVGGLMAPWCQAATLIGFTDTSPMSSSAGMLNDNLFCYGSWTQTVPSTNTVIKAIVARVNGTTGLGHAWLMNQVGPGTTVANQVATADFAAPVISFDAEMDLTAAPYTTLFMGMSLLPGTYYLVLEGPPGGSWFEGTYNWLGDWTGVAVNTASGFTVGAYGMSGAPESYIPATPFTIVDDHWFFRVEGDAIPVPASLLLLGSGLLGLAGWRRFRKG